MRWHKLLAITVAAAVSPLSAEAATTEELERKIESQDALIRQLLNRVEELESARSGTGAAGATAGQQAPESTLPSISQENAERESMPGWGGVYSKPFLRSFGRQVYLGGYFDLEYKDAQDSNATFDQHRLVPFIYADVTDRVKFATEIEIEHGGPDSPGGGDIKVEFATLDYLFSDAVNFRAGIMLSPLGKLNLVHDAPLQDFTARPLVDTYIIPTTLSESGAGFYGSFYAGETGKIDYEAYLVNGFAGTTDGAVNITRANGLRNAKGSDSSDNNDNPAFVGRVAYSPFLGLEVGASEHFGHYDERGSSLLSITALDWTYQRGPFEILGEGAYAAIEHDAYTTAVGVPDDMYGYYVQGNYHFMPDSLREWAPVVFGDESTFTFVNRWGQVNLDGNRRQRYSIGLNFRPTEDTVFKAEHQFNWESGLQASVDNHQLLFSVASYF